MKMSPPSRSTSLFLACIVLAAILACIIIVRHLYEDQLTIPLTPITIGEGSTQVSSATSSVTTSRTTTRTLLTTLKSIPNTTRFRALLSSSGLSDSLTGKGPYTLFVPTDTAFRQLPSGTIDTLSEAQIKHMMSYHIVNTRALNLSAEKAGTITAFSGDVLNISLADPSEAPHVNSAVVIAQYKTQNGIIYLIDTVLIPPTP